MTITDRPDFAAWLTALTDHLTDHPHLTPITTGISQTSPHPYVQVYPVYGQTIRTHLGCLAAWAETLNNVAHVKIAVASDASGNVHLEITGQLGDNDTQISVTALPSGAEADLLTQHTTVEKGATFPTTLLERLALKGVTE